jgi:hypothetical protein
VSRAFPRLLLVLLLIALALFLLMFVPRRQTLVSAPPPATQPASTPPLQHSASSEVHRLRLALGNFLLAVKDPYRPPLGDNRDIARALAGGNRRGLVLVPTNDPAFRDGQLVDPWGTPYWFHPRAPDAIDIVSAGPDRKLFTDDDVHAGRVR